MKTLMIKKPEGFALQAAADFYAGFIPGSGMAATAGDRLTLGFRLDKSFEAVAVALREDRDSVVAEFQGTDDAQGLSNQIARMLGLDADGKAWLAIGRTDPVVGKLQSDFAGFFTAAKPSPYDAAAWAVISPRMTMRAAATLKMAIAEKHGDAIELLGRVHHVFPSPNALLAIDALPGLAGVKWARLQAIARAALEGQLDADRLRAMDARDALADLQALPGIGPWAASHILFRGAALTDGLPVAEPRVLHGLADAYRIESPSIDTLERLAERWRPFRMWVCILLARHLASSGGWNKKGLAGERAAAGRQLRRATRVPTARDEEP
jgi:DNA-3-methyladenine glycosylase II